MAIEPVTQDQDLDEKDDVVVDPPDEDTPPTGDEDGKEGSDADAAKGGDAEDFLIVNDRTRYRTRDEALAAYREAGDRISELSPYATLLEKHGITEPTVLNDVLQDYLRLRKQAETQVSRESGGAPAKEVTSSKLDQLSDKDRENFEYLKKLGFTPAEAFQKATEDRIKALETLLQDRIGQLDQGTRALSDRQQQVTVEAGQSYLAQLLESKGYKAAPAAQEFLENGITDWIQSKSYDRQGRLIPGSLAERFGRGGRAMQEVVAEGFERALNAMASLQIQKDGQYQDSKRQKIRNTPKALPKGSQHKVEGKDDEDSSRKAPLRPGAGGIFQDPKMHDRAFELMKTMKGSTS